MEDKGFFHNVYLIVTKKLECKTDLNTEITITLHKNKEKISCNFLISTIMKVSPSTPEDKTASLTGTYIDHNN